MAGCTKSNTEVRWTLERNTRATKRIQEGSIKQNGHMPDRRKRRRGSGNVKRDRYLHTRPLMEGARPMIRTRRVRKNAKASV